jgi:NAD(P)-dependent dehydrogenase (short-subunit alcohol dehydrogenase family)
MKYNLFDLSDKVAIITGGAGLLGVQHAEIIADAGGNPVLIDINGKKALQKAKEISEKYNVDAIGVKTDITDKGDIEALRDMVLQNYNRVDILINNAANDPKVKTDLDNDTWNRFENFSLENWNMDLAVGLTGALLCTQVIGTEMANRRSGVILNISSDLGLIAPDQRIYEKEGLPNEKQSVKPVSYPVIKSALLGLTRYSATYWAKYNVRVNAICPGGVQTDQPPDFLEKLTYRIPMGRMARIDEYKGAILFLISDASSYMTGAVISIDGGRTCW